MAAGSRRLGAARRQHGHAGCAPWKTRWMGDRLPCRGLQPGHMAPCRGRRSAPKKPAMLYRAGAAGLAAALLVLGSGACWSLRRSSPATAGGSSRREAWARRRSPADSRAALASRRPRPFRHVGADPGDGRRSTRRRPGGRGGVLMSSPMRRSTTRPTVQVAARTPGPFKSFFDGGVCMPACRAEAHIIIRQRRDVDHRSQERRPRQFGKPALPATSAAAGRRRSTPVERQAHHPRRYSMVVDGRSQ